MRCWRRPDPLFRGPVCSRAIDAKKGKVGALASRTEADSVMCRRGAARLARGYSERCNELDLALIDNRCEIPQPYRTEFFTDGKCN